METIRENETMQEPADSGTDRPEEPSGSEAADKVYAYRYGYAVPPEPVRPPFSASLSEVICALLLYAGAYIYVKIFAVDTEDIRILLPLAAAFIIGITEWLCRGVRRSRESLVWLACLVCTVICCAFALSRVWDPGQILLFVHIFAVYWVLSRSGRLLEGESGHLLPADAVCGFVLIPFGNYFLRIRTLVWGIRNLKKGERKISRERAAWTVPILLVCLILFVSAAKLLAAADSGFGRMFGSLADIFRLDLDPDDILILLLSLPVGSWLFGLISGSARLPMETVGSRRSALERFLESIKKIPQSVWVGVIGVFSILYVAFFVMQSTYLFGAFAGKLPEGFIVSRYAREGFFELCKVMALNFALLWLVTRMADRISAAVRSCCLVLLAESMLFAVIAFSKLMMYIDCYGFTPLRFQSCWLVCVLFAGCALWAWSLVSGKKTMKIWMYFGALSLTALCFV